MAHLVHNPTAPEFALPTRHVTHPFFPLLEVWPEEQKLQVVALLTFEYFPTPQFLHGRLGSALNFPGVQVHVALRIRWAPASVLISSALEVVTEEGGTAETEAVVGWVVNDVATKKKSSKTFKVMA
jgi:hypothetical protein